MKIQILRFCLVVSCLLAYVSPVKALEWWEIPVVKGRVGVNVSWVFQEWYEMSPEVRDERYAVELKSPIVCRGDVIFNFYFQALRS